MVYMYMYINFTLMLSDSELGLPVYYSVCSIQFSNFLCILNGAVWPSYTWKSGLGDDPLEKKRWKKKKSQAFLAVVATLSTLLRDSHLIKWKYVKF